MHQQSENLYSKNLVDKCKITDIFNFLVFLEIIIDLRMIWRSENRQKIPTAITGLEPASIY